MGFRVLPKLHQIFWDVRLHWELLGGGGVRFVKPIKHLLKSRDQVVGSHYFCWVGIRGQGNRLANGRNCARY
jgi:hypothetical protein